MRSEPYRIIVWGPGTVGSACLRELLASRGFEVVGVLGYSAEKEGRDIGEVLGMPAVGVRVTTDKDSILRRPADVVLHSPRFAIDLAEADCDVVDLLSSGKNVGDVLSLSVPPRRRLCADPARSLHARRRLAARNGRASRLYGRNARHDAEWPEQPDREAHDSRVRRAIAFAQR
jgi:hypothetical protein